MLVPKRWDPQVLKISLGGALLLDSVSNKCWNSPLLEAVLEGVRAAAFSYNCCLVGVVEEVARSRAPSVPCGD